MKINRLSSRHVVFANSMHPSWILNLHLIIGKKYNYIIDTGFGPENLDEIYDIGGMDRPYIIINSHFHWDHIWGNCNAKNFPIISHRLCPELISKSFDTYYEKNRQYACGHVTQQNPTILFDKELYFAEDKIRIFHTPGHTVDSISVYDEEEKVLNIADNIGDTGNSLIPDLDCGKEVYLKTLEIYKSLWLEKCICAHNDIFGKNIIDEILREM